MTKQLAALAFVLLATSCGEIPKTGTLLGEERSFNPLVVNQQEEQRLQLLCARLNNKAQALSQGSAETFTFSVTEKSCEGTILSSNQLISTGLEVMQGSYRLRRNDNGALFVFPDLETNISGIMKEICGNLSGITSPKKIAGDNVLWFTTTNVSTSDCTPRGNEMCILLETGVPSGSNYVVVAKEWIRFQVDPVLPKAGFYTERKKISQASCGQAKFTEIIATLK
jgi:hypothetical protein